MSETAQASLPATGFAKVMRVFRDPHHPAQRNESIPPYVHRVPPQTSLDHGPAFVHHVVRRHEAPTFPLRVRKRVTSGSVTGIRTVKFGVET
jgi:hypothetical protein